VIALGAGGLQVSTLCFGGNVFGWTADERSSFALLDAYIEGGGNFIDTADSYVQWVPGGRGGESETIIGHWLARRGHREDVVIATKVGQLEQSPGLSARTIAAAADASLSRLGVDHIDLYYAHIDDSEVPLEESLEAFNALVVAGKVRCLGASNYTTPRLAEALRVADENRFARYEVLQTHYNLVHRHEYEDSLASLCLREAIPCVAYSALADGFLTGKYRRDADLPSSERVDDASAYLTAGHDAVLEALDEVARRRQAPLAAVALAWLAARPGVIPLASARTTEQLRDLQGAESLELSTEDLELLDARTAPLADVEV
jgi:aryl-alcohol dehydrogenase-like predicted oxidoreductase